MATGLYEAGYRPLVLHGDMEQKERDQMLVRFANESATLLLATDVAARGLDIANLAAVINYDLSRDPEVHVHRIGRTGRAGQKGLALSLHTRREQYKLDDISTYLNTPLVFGNPARLTGNQAPGLAPMVTLAIDGGRKNKVRPGDILGALTGDAGLSAEQVGKINIFDYVAYVAVRRDNGPIGAESSGTGQDQGTEIQSAPVIEHRPARARELSPGHGTPRKHQYRSRGKFFSQELSHG